MNSNKQSKALVLSGGGITGIAWELGILLGLQDERIDVTDAELIVGTSAGSSVGAQITSGLSLEELYKFQLKPIGETKEIPVQFSGLEFRLMMGRAVMGSPDAQTARARIGEAALAAETMSEEECPELLDSRLPTQEWNQNQQLVINAVDVETGEWITFHRDSGVPLLLAVAASSAVPGVYPPTTINGRRYINGGMSLGTNVDVALGCSRVLILVAEAALTSETKTPTMHRINFQKELAELEKAEPRLW